MQKPDATQNNNPQPFRRGNLFENIPADLSSEVFDTLQQNSNMRIERIISKGHSTAPGTCYDQDWDEWVLLLQGTALLSLEGDATPLAMTAGDYVFIPAHCKHRVEWTDPQQETLWLAIYLAPDETLPFS